MAAPVGEVVFEEGDEDNDDNHGNNEMMTIQVHGSANREVAEEGDEQ